MHNQLMTGCICSALLMVATVGAIALSFGCDAGTGAGRDLGPSADSALDAVAVDLTGPDAASQPDTGPTADVEQADQAAGCLVKRVSDKKLCGPDCGVRLLLPGGDYYCTQQCSATSECTPYGVDLVCPAFGACVPTCAKDDSCVALGFKRCDVAGGNCDTI